MLSHLHSRLLAAFVAILAAFASVTAFAAPSHAAGGSIAGVVQGEASATLADVDVSLYKKQGGHWARWDTVASKSTGKYRFHGLAAGTYRVCANEYRSLPDYFQRCWQTGADVETGRSMHLSADQVIKARRITLLKAGTISGVVAWIRGQSATRSRSRSSTCPARSSRRSAPRSATLYTVGPLETGSYHVQFDRASTQQSILRPVLQRRVRTRWRLRLPPPST